MKPKRILIALLGVFLGYALAYGAFGIVHDRHIASRFSSIQPDATEQSVRALLGAPSSTNQSCQAYGTQLTETCDHVLIWHSTFAPLRQSYWLVFFDASGHTKATSRLAHPG